jgi:DNA-binding winged helix-turn-helix (wHTH) protein
MKSFKAFRLDTANHLLRRNGDRVPITPKAFDVLAYLVERPGRVVTQDEIFEAVWSETFVNPEVLRKYILEIRKALGDRPGNPEFIETVPKRGYRFVATVTDESVDESAAEPPDVPTSHATEESVGSATAPTEGESSPDKHRLWKPAIIVLAVVATAAIAGYLRVARIRTNAPIFKNTSIAVLPFADLSPAKDQEYFSDGLAEQLINDLAKVSGLKVLNPTGVFP